MKTIGITKAQLRQIIQEEKDNKDLELFLNEAMLNENPGKAIGTALGTLIKNPAFQQLVISLLGSVSDEWLKGWLEKRQENKQLGKQPDRTIDNDNDGIPDEDEYSQFEDDIESAVTVAEHVLVLARQRLNSVK